MPGRLVKCKQECRWYLDKQWWSVVFKGKGLIERWHTKGKRDPNTYTIKYSGNCRGSCAFFDRKPHCWQNRGNAHGHRACKTIQKLTNVNCPGREAILPIKKEKATPMPFGKAAADVAVMRWWTGNQITDNTGGTAIATGPAKPFRNWSKFTVLKK